MILLPISIFHITQDIPFLLEIRRCLTSEMFRGRHQRVRTRGARGGGQGVGGGERKVQSPRSSNDDDSDELPDLEHRDPKDTSTSTGDTNLSHLSKKSN